MNKRQQAAKCQSDADAIFAAAKAAGKAPTAEEVKQVNALFDQRDKLLAEADAEDKAAAEAQRVSDAGAVDHAAADLAAAMARADSGRAALSESQGRISSPQAVTSGLRERVLADPRRGFRDYGHFALAVRDACRPGAELPQSLRVLSAAYGQNEGAGEDGGFLTPPEFSNRMLERAQSALGIMAKCDRLTLSGNSIVVNGMADHDQSGTTYRYGGIIAYWLGEAAQITRSSLKFRQVALRLKKLAALAFLTDEEMADNPVNLGGRLNQKMGDAIGNELDEALMFGNGVDRPLGAFSSACCISTTKENNQIADTVIFENIVAMLANLWDDSEGRAEWYCNREVVAHLRKMFLAVGAGGIPVYMPAGGISGERYKTLDGRPCTCTSHCEKLGDAGDIVLGDWSQYLLATKGTIETAMSIHLRFDYGETAFRATFRADGRPAWEKSLTPRKGATAKRESPFVKLEAR